MPGRRRIDVQDEDLRLAYVAMTRAQSQLILWWAATANTPDSGLHRLLFGRAPNLDALASYLAAPPAQRPVAALARADREPRGPAAEAMLTAWADAGAFSLAIVPDEVPLVRAHPPEEQADALTGRDFTRTIDRNWRRTYSALAGAAEANPVGDVALSGDTEPETDTVGNSDEQEVVVADLAGTGVRSPMAGLPVGATFGLLVHAVLETADLNAEDLRAELLERISDERVRWPVDLDADELAAPSEPRLRDPARDNRRRRHTA